MPNLMMKDIPIGSDEYIYDEDGNLSYDDEHLFDIILKNYKTNNQTDIYDFWYSVHNVFLYLEDDSLINYHNDIQLAIIKTYAPDIYDTYEYDEDYFEYDEEHKNIFEPTLDICAEIIKFRFTDKLFKIINAIEGDELSDADTDTEE